MSAVTAIEPERAETAPSINATPPCETAAPIIAAPDLNRLYRFSVSDYHRLINSGFFRPEERCELIHGLIVNKMPRDPIHDAVLEIVVELLRARCPEGWRVRSQMALTTADSEPEPDAVIVRGKPQEYFARHPGPQEIALAVEVSNTSLSGDRGVKSALYAESGVPAYWIVNVVDRRVEVYTDPTGPDSSPAYRRREDYVAGGSIPFRIDGVEVPSLAVSDMLPPANIESD